MNEEQAARLRRAEMRAQDELAQLNNRGNIQPSSPESIQRNLAPSEPPAGLQASMRFQQAQEREAQVRNAQQQSRRGIRLEQPPAQSAYPSSVPQQLPEIDNIEEPELSLPSVNIELDEVEESLENVTIDDLLIIGIEAGASDVHLSGGNYPRMRVDGDMQRIGRYEKTRDEWLDREQRRIMDERQYKIYKDTNDFDFSHTVESYARFRVNFFKQQGRPGAVLRTIPSVIKTIEELGLPASLNDLTRKPNGLILVTGPTGSGKSTTLAAMIESRNRMFNEHIMTIEDPVEFVYESKQAHINQREIGGDTESFNSALKHVLRQDPDVILIGELRDPETISIALTAAETGHLVLGTLHTQSASKSLNRLIDSFPADQQSQVRSQLSNTLQAIISQSLLKRVDGGRIAATEILVRNTAITNNINKGDISQIYSAIQTGRALGMHTLDQELERLVREGLIDRDEALKYVVDPKSLKPSRSY